MTPSFPLSPTHVAGIRKRTGVATRESVTVRFCVGSGRAHRYTIQWSLKTANPVRKERAAMPLPGSVLAARSLSNTQPARFWPLFISLGEGPRRMIQNLFGTLSARSSSLFPFVHDANQPANGLVNRFSLSKILS